MIDDNGTAPGPEAAPPEVITPTPQATPQTNGPITSPAPPQNSFVQNVVTTTHKAFSTIGNFVKPGRGRPRNQPTTPPADMAGESKTAYDGTEDQMPESQNIPLNTGPADFVTRSSNFLWGRFAGLFKTGKKLLQQVVLIQCDAADLDSARYRTTLAQNKPSPELEEDLNKAIALCAEKYKISTEWAPELALGSCLIELYGPDALVLVEINAEIKRRRHRERMQAAAPVPMATHHK